MKALLLVPLVLTLIVLASTSTQADLNRCEASKFGSDVCDTHPPHDGFVVIADIGHQVMWFGAKAVSGCLLADVNFDRAVTVGDIGQVVDKFGDRSSHRSCPH